MLRVLSSPRIRYLLVVSTLFIGILYIFLPANDGSGASATSHTSYRAAWLENQALKKVWNWRQRPEEVVVEHPIPKLMHDAQVKFKALVSKQSKTLEQACREYRRRYKRDPPKGFDHWWEFTQKNNVTIIDEYDGLFEDFEPFWAMSGAELRKRAVMVGHLPSIDLVRLENGTAFIVEIEKEYFDSDITDRAKGWLKMIKQFQHLLPDMYFPINGKAEGRILVPWEDTKYPNHETNGTVEDILGGVFTVDWRGKSSVWEAFRRTCDPSSPARRLFGSFRPNANEVQRPINRLKRVDAPLIPGGDFDFVERVNNDLDYCAEPHARYHQGHFFSDWRTIPVLFPLFTSAKAEGYSDIRIPSHYYHVSTPKYTYGLDTVTREIKELDPGEVPWSQKSNKIFWRGATTGGGGTPPGFAHQYQRHRFIKISSDKSDANRTVVFPSPNSLEYTFAEVPVKDMNKDIMDAAFTKTFGCEAYPGGCDKIRKDLRFDKGVPLGENWKHKFLIDFDGQGYSARFLALLMSESAVLKSTVYKEFFTEYIQPWLHYIPLSSDYSEIYNIHAYFAGASPTMLSAASTSNSTTASNVRITHPPSLPRHSGDAELRKIARAGRQWKMTHARKIDMETYVFRLCLEYARLYSDDRESMNYTGYKG